MSGNTRQREPLDTREGGTALVVDLGSLWRVTRPSVELYPPARKSTQQPGPTTMRRTPAFGAALILLSGVACGGSEPPAETPEAAAPAAAVEAPPAAPAVALPEGVTAEMVQAGATLYAGGTCAGCHGPAGTGTPGIGPDLTDAIWLTGDGSIDSIVEVINTGVPTPKEHPGPMPAKGGNASLTDEQVRQIAAHVYAISHGGN